MKPNRLTFEPLHKYLPALIQSGDLEGYQRARQVLLHRFGGTTDLHVADCMLKDCLITPWPDADYDQLEKLADTPMHDKDRHWWEYLQFAKGLLEYRRANYESAVRYTGHATRVSYDPYLIVPACMVRAMAHQQLGDAEEARKVLANGLEFSHATFRREGQLTFDRLWQDWIIAHALMDEASALIDPRLGEEVPKSLATCRHPTFAVDNLYFLALEKLRSGNEVGYRRVCEVLALVPEANANNTTADFRRIWTWCLGPHNDVNLATQLSRARQLFAGDSLDAPYAEQLVLGAMLYRMGKYQSATKHLEASLAGYPSHPSSAFGTMVYPRLFLSMARSRLGQLPDAARLLDETQPAIDAALESPSTLWDYRTTIEVLHREAKSLIEPKQTGETATEDAAPQAAPANSIP